MAELRRIRSLRLRAPRREQVARAAIALEDALRTASLPRLPQGAILLVRRLDLGRLPADASPQWLSRHIEMRLRDLRPEPVRIRHEEPAAAPAVWFADRSEALAALLATSVRDVPRAWYWAGVLPGWRPRMTLRELLPLALRRAEDEPHAPAGASGVAALLDRLLRQDRLDAVLEHLEPDHLAPPAGAGAATATPASGASRRAGEAAQVAKDLPPRSATEASVAAVASDTWRAALGRWLRRWGPADPRTRWLAAHALVALHGPAAAAHAGRLIDQLARLQPYPAGNRLQPPVRESVETDSDAPERRSPPAGSGLDPEPGLPEPAGDVVRLTTRDAPGGAIHVQPRAEPDWEPTRYGGLLLLLPALARLQIHDADPDGDLCLRLLHRIADRLKIRRDDAIRRALPEPLPRTAPCAFVPPPAWDGLMRPRRLDLGREDGVLAVCQLALARFLRRYAKISPRRLIRRPALVYATPTHIDLCFDARWVELEVRLAGLDLDPGWVPWLGRVVSFHYDYGAERP